LQQKKYLKKERKTNDINIPFSLLNYLQVTLYEVAQISIGMDPDYNEFVWI